jgi:hypothetical protein
MSVCVCMCERCVCVWVAWGIQSGGGDFKRLQYPVRLSFAMTINKAQGQSLSVTGVNLESSCFSRGQLQYTDQEIVPARNARNVVTLAEVMFVTIQRENILPSKITD